MTLGCMVTEYNKAYWQRIKADPERLSRYKARRNKNQVARRTRAKHTASLADRILEKLQELPQHPVSEGATPGT